MPGLRPDASTGAADECGPPTAALASPSEATIQHDCEWRSTEATFIRRYVQHRVIEPTINWYGTKEHVVSNAIKELMGPRASLQAGSEFDLGPVEESVSVALFDGWPMEKFIREITDLEEVVNPAPTPEAGD